VGWVWIFSGTTQCNSCFANDEVDWKEIYSLPHHVSSETKMLGL
jgi:hypothetical protein